MRIAAIADLHYRINSAGQIHHWLEGIETEADVLILAGDLTDTGLPTEMQVLIDDLKAYSMPLIAVLGNHDHESDQPERLMEMLRNRGILVLQGNVIENDGFGFVGTKGFCGGFDKTIVNPFGERILKDFIEAGIHEATQLETAIENLDCEHKVAVLHYSPILETLVGEPPEIYAFLGSSRLARALDRHGVDLILHGHAHHGSPEGRTPGGIPVYNVSRFVLTQAGLAPYRIFEV